MLSLAIRAAIRLSLLAPATLLAPAPFVAGAPGGLPAAASAARADTGSVVTEVPDACELLTPADAAELLGDEVTDPYTADIAGLGNCAYRAEATGRQLALILQLGRDDSVEGTQLAMNLEYCGAEVAARPDSLGRAAALYRSPEEPCGRSMTLWVATGLGFEGKPNPDLLRPVTGRLQLVLAGDSDPEEGARPDAGLPMLREAAERALVRLTDRAEGSD